MGSPQRDTLKRVTMNRQNGRTKSRKVENFIPYQLKSLSLHDKLGPLPSWMIYWLREYIFYGFFFKYGAKIMVQSLTMNFTLYMIQFYTKNKTIGNNFFPRTDNQTKSIIGQLCNFLLVCRQPILFLRIQKHLILDYPKIREIF